MDKTEVSLQSCAVRTYVYVCVYISTFEMQMELAGFRFEPCRREPNLSSVANSRFNLKTSVGICNDDGSSPNPTDSDPYVTYIHSILPNPTRRLLTPLKYTFE